MAKKNINPKRNTNKLSTSMPTKHIEPDADMVDYLFKLHSSPINEDIQLDEKDTLSKTKVYCKEPYAASLFNKYKDYFGEGRVESKDLVIGEIYTVSPTVVNFNDKMITVEEVSSKMPIYVSFSDYIDDISSLTGGSVKDFKIHVTKNINGCFYGTRKKILERDYWDELKSHYENGTWFTVKLINLVRGGYMALYKNSVQCFIPGSHAAANVIKDFNSLLGTELTVVIDNFDSNSSIYIVSYKKYIAKTLRDKVKDLVFGKKYTGSLTSKPTDYGMFVELENYYTGLIHKTEFENYHEIRKKYRIGDDISCYVKDVQITSDDKVRIVLTTNKDSIEKTKLEWQRMKNDIIGDVMDYYYDQSSKKLYLINDEGLNFGVDIDPKLVETKMYKHKKVKITDVDVIYQNIDLEFCS